MHCFRRENQELFALKANVRQFICESSSKHHRPGGLSTYDTPSPLHPPKKYMKSSMPPPPPRLSYRFPSLFSTQRRMLKDYRTVMHTCLHSGAWDQALELWFELRAQPQAPTPCAATYALALRACSALGRWETARDLVAEMKAAGGDFAPRARHYALTFSAAIIADDRAFDERAAFDRRGGWGVESAVEGEGAAAVDRGNGNSSNASRGDATGSPTALKLLLSEILADGVELGWEAYAAVCWARSKQSQWYRASLGVLELMDEFGLRDIGSPTTAVDVTAGTERSREGAYNNVAVSTRQPQQWAEGIRSLYARMLAAAGKVPQFLMPELGTGYVIRQVLADAEERLSAVGGLGPHVIAVAARAFAQAEDWEGTREIALRFASRDERGSPVSLGGGEEIDADERDAAFVVIGAAVSACASADEVEHAEALAELARKFAALGNTPTSSSAEEGLNNRPSGIFEKSRMFSGVEVGVEERMGEGIGRKASLALALAYERAGRFSDAERVRLRLQEQYATGLKLEVPVTGGEGGGVDRRLRGLPTIGGSIHIRSQAGGEDSLRPSADDGGGGSVENEKELDEEGYRYDVGGADEYDLFLEWMVVAGQDDEGGYADSKGSGWQDGRVGGAGRLAQPREVAGTEWEGLTVRELEGW